MDYNYLRLQENMYFLYEQNYMSTFYYVVHINNNTIFYNNEYHFLHCIYYVDEECVSSKIKPDHLGNYNISLKCDVSFGKNSYKIIPVLLEIFEIKHKIPFYLEYEIFYNIKKLNKINIEKYYNVKTSIIKKNTKYNLNKKYYINKHKRYYSKKSILSKVYNLFNDIIYNFKFIFGYTEKVNILNSTFDSNLNVYNYEHYWYTNKVLKPLSEDIIIKNISLYCKSSYFFIEHSLA